MDEECGSGSACSQVGGDLYCAALCPKGNECDADHACVQVKTSSGQTVSACVAKSGACAPHAMDMPSPTDGGVPLTDAGGPVTGQIGPNGGTASRLFFATVGDTRPPLYNDTAGYPTSIITKIYQDIQNLNPRPQFVLSTGDYQFAQSYGNIADQQFQIYMTARQGYSGVLFPAMGNHECTGSVTSNCGQGNVNGLTSNYSAFMSRMLAPIQKTDPYYSVNVNDSNGKWTAKFVFIAANAWTSAQASWLQTVLGQATTYTFIVRHEPHDAIAPGVAPSEAIMAQHPYTLCVVGHTHSYYHFPGREVLIGNGGAPLTGNKNYGFGVFNQRNDGTIQVDVLDYDTGLADSYFRFAVHPDGSPAKL